MNFITQLLPGLRDVRGPLVAGYLWLFAAWLFLGEPIPRQGTVTDAYKPLFELGEAVGRIGLAAVISVAAYLVGSLIQAAIGFVASASKWLVRQVTAMVPRLRTLDFVRGFAGPERARTLLGTPPIFAPAHFSWLDGDEEAKLALNHFVRNRLGTAVAAIEFAIEKAATRVRDGAGRTGSWSAKELENAAVEITALRDPSGRWEVTRWIAVVGDEKAVDRAAPTESSVVPGFSADKDLFGERATIKTRLMETAEHAGSEVERLYAESDFRFTIAFPLAAVAIALTSQTGDLWWLGLIVGVAGLLMHSIVLRKHAGREMIEALRSRPDRDKLDQVTPVFARYEEDAKKFAVELEKRQWEAVAAAIRPPPPVQADEHS